MTDLTDEAVKALLNRDGDHTDQSLECAAEDLARALLEARSENARIRADAQAWTGTVYISAPDIDNDLSVWTDHGEGGTPYVPLADAQAAVAMVVEKAADVVKGLHEKLCTAGHPTLMLGQVTTQTLALEAAVRTLADTDGLARVEALRKERDDAAMESKTAWALLRVANDNTAGAISERDRLAADLAAVQAEIEALRDVYWKLRSYAVHDDGCKLNKPPYKVGSCSCGLTSALARGEAALAALPAKEGE